MRAHVGERLDPSGGGIHRSICFELRIERRVAAGVESLARVVEMPPLQVGVMKPERIVAAGDGRLRARGALFVDDVDGAAIGVDHVVPHAHGDENVRRHVQRVTGAGRDEPYRRAARNPRGAWIGSS